MPTTVVTRIDGLNDPPLSAPNTNLTLRSVAGPATAQRILAVATPRIGWAGPPFL